MRIYAKHILDGAPSGEPPVARIRYKKKLLEAHKIRCPDCHNQID